MSDRWTSYLSNVNDVLSSIFVDLGLRGAAPDSTRPHLLWVWVTLRAPRADGLSSNEEAPALNLLEDALVSLFERELHAMHAGRITGDSRREFYFYAPSAVGFEQAIVTIFSAFPDYPPSDFGEQPDPSWNQYLGLLYPSVQQIQSIQNREVISALRDAGDVLTMPRPISHWLYFASIADREAVSRELEQAGFRRGEVAEPDMAQRFPYGLHLQKDGLIEQNDMDATVLRILSSLEGRAGQYDGWESEVVKTH